MLLDDLRGEVVLIKLRTYEELVAFGISSTNVYAKIIEIDDRVGIWVENPSWSPRMALPTDEDETHLAHILIKWEYVIGIIVFPERADLLEEKSPRNQAVS